jgi:CBS domain containing-hemolysin-like protein
MGKGAGDQFVMEAQDAMYAAPDPLSNLVIVGLCLFLSGFFVATETALTSLSSLKTKHLQEKSRGASGLTLWLENPQLVLTSLMVLTTFVHVFLGVYVGFLVFKSLGLASVWLAPVIVTLALVLIGAVLPKAISRRYAERLAVPLMFLFQGFYWFTYPATWVLTRASALFSTLLGSRDGDKPAPQITEEELEFLINIGEEEGVIEEQKHGMLSGIFEMGETIVREIMIPRPDMVTLPQSAKITDAVKVFEETGHSRLPIYEGKVDNVVGVVHAKDALYFLRRHRKQPDGHWDATVGEIKREAMFTLETKTVDDLFEDMRKARQQLAVVIDEHGDTSGVVSMEDIFEEIVGEIRDEYDNEEDAIRPTKVPGTFSVDCKIHIDDFCDFFEIEPKSLEVDGHSEDYDTLAGLIVHHFGQVPRVGESLKIGHLDIEVTDLSRRRVRRVLVKGARLDRPVEGSGESDAAKSRMEDAQENQRDSEPES